MAMNKRVAFQLFLVSMLLVVLPLGSFLYLKAGHDYRRASLDELVEFGEAAKFASYKAIESKSVDVVYLTPTSANDSVGLSIQSLYSAFEKMDSIQFVGLGKLSSPLISDPTQATEIASGSFDVSAFEQMTAKDVHCQEVPIYQRAVVVDTNGIVRRCYDLHKGAEVNRIVEQLNILVPRPEEEDIYVQPIEEY